MSIFYDNVKVVMKIKSLPVLHVFLEVCSTTSLMSRLVALTIPEVISIVEAAVYIFNY